MVSSINPHTTAIHFGAVSTQKKGLTDPEQIYVTSDQVVAAGLRADLLEKSSLLGKRYVVYADGEDAESVKSAERALDAAIDAALHGGPVNSKLMAKVSAREAAVDALNQAKQAILEKLATQ